MRDGVGWWELIRLLFNGDGGNFPSAALPPAICRKTRAKQTPPQRGSGGKRALKGVRTASHGSESTSFSPVSTLSMIAPDSVLIFLDRIARSSVTSCETFTTEG